MGWSKNLKNHICMAPYNNFAKSFFIVSVSLWAFLIYFHMLTNMHHNFHMPTNNLIKTSYVNEQCTIIFMLFFTLHILFIVLHFLFITTHSLFIKLHCLFNRFHILFITYDIIFNTFQFLMNIQNVASKYLELTSYVI